MKENSSTFFWVGKDEVGGGLLGGHWQGLLGFGWGGEGPERPLMAFVRLPQESTLAHFMLIPRLPTLAKPPLPHWHANSITADFRQRRFFIESSHRIVSLRTDRLSIYVPSAYTRSSNFPCFPCWNSKIKSSVKHSIWIDYLLYVEAEIVLLASTRLKKRIREEGDLLNFFVPCSLSFARPGEEDMSLWTFIICKRPRFSRKILYMIHL